MAKALQARGQGAGPPCVGLTCGVGGSPAPSLGQPKPIGVEGEPAPPPRWAPPSSTRVCGGKTRCWPCDTDTHGRSRLQHQGHVPLQADLGAEPRRDAQGHGQPPALLPLASRRRALQGLATRRGRLRSAMERHGCLPPAPAPLLLLDICYLRVSCLPAGLAQQQLENVLQVSA